jgi:putative peptidoglycan lipid II flippase
VLAYAAFRRGLVSWPGGGWDPHMVHVGSQYAPVVLGSLLMSSSAVVDQSMAASLGSGTVSVLDYGNKIVALVLSIVALSLSTVLFPRFSRLIAAGRWDELGRTINGYAKWILLASFPVVVLLAVLAEPMIRLLFERGKFTADTTRAVSLVQACLSLQVPFYIVAMLGTRALSAMDANQIVLRIGALNLLMNIAGNYAFMQWFGVNGIALSTSLMYAIAMTVTLFAVRYKVAEARSRQ